MNLPTKRWHKNGLTITMSGLSLCDTDQMVGRRRLWKLASDFVLRIESDGMTQKVVVPAGFDTDFATMPVFSQLLLGNRDTWVQAAVVHDWLLVTHVPSWLADSWFRSALLVLGCSWWKRVMFFWSVHLYSYVRVTRQWMNKLGSR